MHYTPIVNQNTRQVDKKTSNATLPRADQLYNLPDDTFEQTRPTYPSNMHVQ